MAPPRRALLPNRLQLIDAWIATLAENPLNILSEVEKYCKLLPLPIDAKAMLTSVDVLRERDQDLIIGLLHLVEKLPEQTRALHNQLFDYLFTLPQCDFPTSLQWEEFSPQDDFAFKLVNGFLAIAKKNPGMKNHITTSLWHTFKTLARCLKEDTSGDKMVHVYLPLFNGFHRAFSQSDITFTPDPVPLDIFELIQVDLLKNVDCKLKLLPPEENEQPSYFFQFFVKYSRTTPFSTGYLVKSIYEIIAHALELTLMNVVSHDIPIDSPCVEKTLKYKRRSSLPPTEEESLNTVFDCANQQYLQAKTMANDIRDLRQLPYPEDFYISEILQASMRVMTLCCIHLNKVIEPTLTILLEPITENPLLFATLIDDVCTLALKCLGLLAASFHSITPHVKEAVEQFLLSPTGVFFYLHDPDSRLALQKAVISVYISCQGLLDANLDPTPIIYTFMNTFHTIPLKTTTDSELLGERHIISENIILTISYVVNAFNQPKIYDLATSVLIHCWDSLPPAVFPLLENELIEIGSKGTETSLKEILQFFVQRNKQAIRNSSVSLTIDAEEKLAKSFQKQNLQSIYLFHTLEVLLEVFSRECQHSKVLETRNTLEIYLPRIRTVLKNWLGAPIAQTPAQKKLLRNIWILCVFYGYDANDSQSNSQWTKLMEALAPHTPSLVFNNGNQDLDTELELNSILRCNFQEKNFPGLRDSLKNNLSEQYSTSVRNLNFNQLSLLVSVFLVENLRVQHGSIENMLQYFSDIGIIRAKNVAYCLEGIAEHVARNIIAHHKKISEDPTAIKNLNSVLRTLLIYCCHSSNEVASISTQILNMLINNFPHMLCSMELVSTLKELLRMLWNSIDPLQYDEFNPSYTYNSVYEGISIELGDDREKRIELFLSFSKVAENWLQLAYNRSGYAIQATLVNHLADIKNIIREAGMHVSHSFSTSLMADQRGKWDNHDPNHIAPINGDEFTSVLACQSYYLGEVNAIEQELLKEQEKTKTLDRQSFMNYVADFKVHVKSVMKSMSGGSKVSIEVARGLMYKISAIIISQPETDHELLRFIAFLPVHMFNEDIITTATSIWALLIFNQPKKRLWIIKNINESWKWTMQKRIGLFSDRFSNIEPFATKITYTPSENTSRETEVAMVELFPHFIWISFWESISEVVNEGDCRMHAQWLIFVIKRVKMFCICNVARQAWFKIFVMTIKFLHVFPFKSVLESYHVREQLYDAIFSWFAHAPRWSAAKNRVIAKREIDAVVEVYNLLQDDTERIIRSKSSEENKTNPEALIMKNSDERINYLLDLNSLCCLLVENEVHRLWSWSFPDSSPDQAMFCRKQTLSLEKAVNIAWNVNPSLAIQIGQRFPSPEVHKLLTTLVNSEPNKALSISEAVKYLLNDFNIRKEEPNLKYLIYWRWVYPIDAVTMFSPIYKSNPFVLQYAMRVLEHFPIQVVFFYIPQLVQALRYDDYGYVEYYIMLAACSNQKFAHQIIWNMKANMFKDEESQTVFLHLPDDLKPKLEYMISKIVHSLSGEDKLYYEREFNFFSQITGISGTLKPFIRKTKAEKKKKIDEELKKVVVDPGVYLPSNPDGVLVDIDYESGKPLQSHAKAPFLASFKIKREKDDSNDDSESGESVVIQSAIFKVGDDCRQDVLALQLIAMFKKIFTSAGVLAYLCPYRVVATAPGCGVIDVVPNAISRDQLGREKINSLNEHFLYKYGGVNTINYQRARNCFIRSVAAYSIVSFLLQIKDRHNGNILVDDDGHFIHIDFGFILDISPGGISFESNAFKLTTEMIQVLGGRVDSPSFQLFSNLCIKGYLASREYADELINMVIMMQDSGLPCFKGESTIRKMRQRFQLTMNEREAADFMRDKIGEAFENFRTVIYDSFQKMTNGIPY